MDALYDSLDLWRFVWTRAATRERPTLIEKRSALGMIARRMISIDRKLRNGT